VKKVVKIIGIAVILAAISTPQISEGQSWGGGRKKATFWDNWSVNANGGLTSFYGDLSMYDTEIMEKLTKESGPAFGGVVTKYFNAKFGVSGQLLYGNLKGTNTTKISFKASFVEYNIQFRVNFVKLFSPYSLSKFGIEAYGGAGQFVFKSTKYDLSHSDPDTDVQNTGTPEFVYFAGMGASYKINDMFGVTFDVSMRQAQNDKLDDYVKNKNFDYYSYTNIGITYQIQSNNKKSYGRRPTNTRGRMPGWLPMRKRR